KLGIRYLWNDALCIIQDHAEDRNRELVKMHETYSGAAINILASSARNASGALYG
ncbi:hypothetical protein BJ875DRAFT_337721, partial [Amylocarpus encephaloides]